MKRKWIINQDRDEIIKVTRVSMFDIKPVDIKGRLAGFNLLARGRLLGTFDTFEEVSNELRAIITLTDDFYIVSGYSSYK